MRVTMASATCNRSERFCFFVSSRLRHCAELCERSRQTQASTARLTSAPTAAKIRHGNADGVLVPTARGGVDATHGGQRGEPDDHADAADGEDSRAKALQQRHGQTYTSHRAHGLWYFSHFFACQKEPPRTGT